MRRNILIARQDRLKKDQKEKVTSFMGFTNTMEAYAIKQLKKFNWNAEAAIADYFDNPPSWEETGVVQASKLDALFDEYKGWLLFM